MIEDCDNILDDRDQSSLRSTKIDLLVIMDEMSVFNTSV